MDILSAIRERRSFRKYEDKPIPEETIRELIDYSILAPNGSHAQPWRFVVVQDRQLLSRWSEAAKAFMLAKLGDTPAGEKYRGVLGGKSDLFHNAPALIMVFADPAGSLSYVNDCTLAAYNIMLAAHAKGLGSCWIGLFTPYANTPAFKESLGVPESFKMVAPVIVGYPRGEMPFPPRKEAQILAWKK